MVISKVFQIFAISVQLARAADSVSELKHYSCTAKNLPSLVEFLWKVEHTTFIQKVEEFESYGDFEEVDPDQLVILLCENAVNNESDWENFQKKNWELFLSKLNPEALTTERVGSVLDPCWNANIEDRTILNKASSFGNSELVKMILDKLPKGFIQNFSVWNSKFSRVHIAVRVMRNVEVVRAFFEHKSLRLSDFVAKTEAPFDRYVPVGSTCLMMCLCKQASVGAAYGIVVLKAHFTLFLKERLKGICDLKLTSRFFNKALKKLPDFPTGKTKTVAPVTELQGMFKTIPENVVTLIGERMMKDIVTTAADDFKTLLNETKNDINHSAIDMARRCIVMIENKNNRIKHRQERLEEYELILDLMENPVKLLELP